MIKIVIEGLETELVKEILKKARKKDKKVVKVVEKIKKAGFKALRGNG